MTDYTVIGHIAIDRVITATEERVQIGGPPTYASLAAGVMGGEIEAITKVGSDIGADHISQLEWIGIKIRENIVKDASTTKFLLDYRVPDRRLNVEGVCVDILPCDVIEATEAVVLSPIVGEIPQKTYTAIDAEVLALDPQGFVREVHPDGAINLRDWYDEDLLQRIDVFKSSERELRSISQEIGCLKGLKKLTGLGVEVAIATKGAGGSTLMTDSGAFDVPSVEDLAVRDPTGAGDVFMGCFFQTYLEGEDPIWCACMGSAMASGVVETVGPKTNLSMKEVKGRAEVVYDRVLRV
jgi:ribokinase